MTTDGGMMKNITISNIVMENVRMPIFVQLGNRARPYKLGTYVLTMLQTYPIFHLAISMLAMQKCPLLFQAFQERK